MQSYRAKEAVKVRTEINVIARADDWVEVRSKQEILQTLDENGCSNEKCLFMPQMFEYAASGSRSIKAHTRLADPRLAVASRYLADAVHLNLRCNSSYGGCQHKCLLFWKEAWLKPVSSVAAHSVLGRAKN